MIRNRRLGAGHGGRWNVGCWTSWSTNIVSMALSSRRQAFGLPRRSCARTVCGRKLLWRSATVSGGAATVERGTNAITTPRQIRASGRVWFPRHQDAAIV